MTRSTKTAAAGCLLAVWGALGCASADRPSAQDRLADYVDPCWPERYSSVARQEVLEPFSAQAMNGSIIDATVWNYHFEPQSDKLTPAGLEKIDYLVRRRPAAETHLFIQTARDLAYNQNVPTELATKRSELDAKRIKAVKDYYASQAAAKGVTPDIQVIDPADPSMPARYMTPAFNALPGAYKSTIGTGGGGGGTGGGGGGTGGGR
ncbi:MAG TPA: hypothetical protein VGJ05_21235 [Fimbriiglobus sp.]|jgi:hypothetical protein